MRRTAGGQQTSPHNTRPHKIAPAPNHLRPYLNETKCPFDDDAHPPSTSDPWSGSDYRRRCHPPNVSNRFIYRFLFTGFIYGFLFTGFYLRVFIHGPRFRWNAKPRRSGNGNLAVFIAPFQRALAHFWPRECERVRFRCEQTAALTGRKHSPIRFLFISFILRRTEI